MSAVEQATADLSFDTDTPDMAAAAALLKASNDPTVMMVLQTARTTPHFAVSSAVSYLNAVVPSGPGGVSRTAVSPVVSYLNAIVPGGSGGVARLAVSPVVSYLNALATGPGGAMSLAVSPVVSYRNDSGAFFIYKRPRSAGGPGAASLLLPTPTATPIGSAAPGRDPLPTPTATPGGR
jgi:hypothetical protein